MRQALVLFLLAGLLSVAPAAADPLPLTTKPIESFTPHLADAPSAPLTFLGGLIVTSSEKRFGGLSGIDMLDPDTAFIVGDRGVYVRMRLVHDNGRLVGLSDGEIGSLFPAGKVEKDVGDAEDVALAPDDRNKGVLVRERQANAMLAFHLENGRPVDFIPIRVGADNRILRSNQGLESVAYPPAASPSQARSSPSRSTRRRAPPTFRAGSQASEASTSCVATISISRVRASCRTAT